MNLFAFIYLQCNNHITKILVIRGKYLQCAKAVGQTNDFDRPQYLLNVIRSKFFHFEIQIDKPKIIRNNEYKKENFISLKALKI